MRRALIILALGCAERALPLPDRRDLGPDRLTLAEFAEQYGREVCARELRCGFLDQAEVTTCELYFQYGWDAMADRNYRFDPGAARTCLDGLRALDCLALSFQHCDGVLTATGALGQECAQDCAHGLYCDDTRCPSTCVQQDILPLGAHCESNSLSRCEDGSYCPYPDGICTRIGGAGAACQGHVTDQCSDGLYCKPTGGGGTCQPPSAAGEPCFNTAASYAACQSGLVCQGGEYPVGTCGPFVAEGQECKPLEPCGEGLRCAGGYQTGAGRCMRPLPEGAPCLPGDECRDFTLCMNGVCARPLPTLREACDRKNDNCSVGFCDDGVCRPSLYLNDPCDPDGSFKQCRSGFCTRASRTCGRCP